MKMFREGLLTRKTSKLLLFQVPIIVQNCDQLRFQGLDLPRDHLMPLLSSQFSKKYISTFIIIFSQLKSFAVALILVRKSIIEKAVVLCGLSFGGQ